jgi:hypothetical protein
MASTTNFNWSTPDDTALVKDGAAAIRTLGSSIDTSFVDLKGGTTGQVLAKASNTDLDFVWSADAAGISATIFDAKGDLIAASAADTAARLAVGTNGQVLTASSGAATGLAWTTIASSPIKQIVNVQLSGAGSISNASGSYADVTGLTATITPTSASSKVYAIVTIHQSKMRNSSATNMFGFFNLMRDATQLTELPIGLVAMASFGTNAEDLKPIAISWYDSPATTSATTYKVQFKTSAGTIFANNDASLTLMEI